MRVPPHLGLRGSAGSLLSDGESGTSALAVGSWTSWNELLTGERNGSWEVSWDKPVILLHAFLHDIIGLAHRDGNSDPNRNRVSIWSKVYLSPCSGQWRELGWDRMLAGSDGDVVLLSKGLRFSWSLQCLRESLAACCDWKPVRAKWHPNAGRQGWTPSPLAALPTWEPPWLSCNPFAMKVKFLNYRRDCDTLSSPCWLY